MQSVGNAGCGLIDLLNLEMSRLMLLPNLSSIRGFSEIQMGNVKDLHT